MSEGLYIWYKKGSKLNRAAKVAQLTAESVPERQSTRPGTERIRVRGLITPVLDKGGFNPIAMTQPQWSSAE